MENVFTLIELIFKDKEGNVYLWESLKNKLQNNRSEIVNFCNIMKNKINGDNKPDILLAVNLIDFATDFGSSFLWEKIDSKDFLSCIMNKLKNNKDPEIRSVCLYLINKLNDKFKDYPSLQNSVNIYNTLKNSNINFPKSLTNSYRNYYPNNNKNNNGNTNNNINKNNDNKNINVNNNINNMNTGKNKYMSSKTLNFSSKNNINPSNPEDYIKNINIDLSENKFKKRYAKLVNKLKKMTFMIQEMNVLINKNKHSIYNEKLKNLYNDLKDGQRKINKTIEDPKLEDENLMSICLNVVDDVNISFERYEKSIKGENPGPFYTSFNRDDNPYVNKKKFASSKALHVEEKQKEKLEEVDLGDTIKTQFVGEGEGNKGNNFMKNSLNVLFGDIEKSEIINPGENKNLNLGESNKYFNSMSQLSNQGDVNNQNKYLLDKQFNILNNSNAMIIGNKIINNKEIHNNFLLNNNKKINNINNQNNNNNNNNNQFNQLNNTYFPMMRNNYNPNNTNNSNNRINNNNINNNNINKPNNYQNLQNNNNFNYNNRNISGTQFVFNHYNLDNI